MRVRTISLTSALAMVFTMALALGACSSSGKEAEAAEEEATSGGEAAAASDCCAAEGRFGDVSGTFIISAGSEVLVMLPGEGWAASCSAEYGAEARNGENWHVTMRSLGEMDEGVEQETLLDSFFRNLDARLEQQFDDYRVEHVELAPSDLGPLLMFVSTFTVAGQPKHGASFVRVIQDENAEWWLLYLSYEAPPSQPLTETQLDTLAMPLVASFAKAEPGQCE